MTPTCQPAGVPIGGQFAAGARGRVAVILDDPPPTTTVAYPDFGSLPESARHAVRHISHDETPEEQEEWQREQGFRYEIETVPMTELQRRLTASGTLEENFGDWDTYNDWYTGGETIPDHGDSRWPVIEAEATLDPDGEYLHDGWHRMHSYLAAGDATVEILRIVQ